MHLSHLGIADFRSYPAADVDLAPGVTVLLGRNGQGKTNLVEAAGYVASLSSHRVAQDAPLVRAGAPGAAIVRATVVRDGRESLVELEIVPGRANRARLNRSPVARQRDVLGTLRSVLFAPEDLALVKGDPGERRRFLDDLLVARQPRWAAVRADYDRTVRQRGALLKQAAHLWRAPTRRSGGPRLAPGESLEDARSSALATLAVFDDQLAQIGGALLYARLRLLRDLQPYLDEAYRTISDSDTPARATYRSSLTEGSETARGLAAAEVPEQTELVTALLGSIEELRGQEQERGVCLVGPHRDDLTLTLGDLPAKATPVMGSRGAWRSRSGWPASTCCATTWAPTRSWSWTTSSPSWTRAGVSGWPTWWATASRCSSPRRSRPTSRTACSVRGPGSSTWSSGRSPAASGPRAQRRDPRTGP
ncbi:DNA replication/repair protein RecF [Serinicoccus sp. CNJ-927]|uniref:DNA replication/repair protein RecF n=1 Tax=Serinicoccus sp. CNJ-927 TaxID=1904970 RepID=UPI000A518E51